MSINKDLNEFEGKLKISKFPSKKEILEKINAYCEKYRKEEKSDSKSKSKSKEKQIKNKNSKNIQIKNYNNDIYNIDAKDNPRLNKLLFRSVNFNKRNINKYMSPENSKMKIYESIFLAGPYVNQLELLHKEERKNKAKWLNQKGFIPYISKKTILQNENMIDNILYKEAHHDPVYPFRPVQKSKWVGKQTFLPYRY